MTCAVMTLQGGRSDFAMKEIARGTGERVSVERRCCGRYKWKCLFVCFAQEGGGDCLGRKTPLGEGVTVVEMRNHIGFEGQGEKDTQTHAHTQKGGKEHHSVCCSGVSLKEIFFCFVLICFLFT